MADILDSAHYAMLRVLSGHKIYYIYLTMLYPLFGDTNKCHGQGDFWPYHILRVDTKLKKINFNYVENLID